MNPDEFEKIIQDVGLGVRGFARLVKMSFISIHGFKSGRQAIKPSNALYFRLIHAKYSKEK